ncbi:MAG: hypothetical protein JWN41_1751 [Thermoleophilia bacterium]|nr:hypothetical protein [Thermoleophilia bacterium]
MKFSFLFLLVTVWLLSCKKKESVAEPKAGYLQLFWYRKTEFDPTKQEIHGQAAAARFAQGRGINNLDTGGVRYGDSVLHKEPFDFEYGIATGPNEPSFLSAFDVGKTWVVTGKTGSVPAFTATAPPIPTFIYKNMDTLPLLKAGSPFTLNWDGTVPCDSLEVYLGTFSIPLRTIAGTSASVTFSGSEITSLINRSGTNKTYIMLRGSQTKEINVEGMVVQIQSLATRIIQF